MAMGISLGYRVECITAWWFGTFGLYVLPILISYVMYLIGGLEHGWIICPYLGNVIIPTDELHHFLEG